MYEEITDGLIREYPHLLSSGGLPATSARVCKNKWFITNISL